MPTKGAAASRLGTVNRTVDVYCHDTMYAIDLARLQETSERYEAARAIVRWVQDRCPNVCKSLRHLFRRASVDSATRRRSDNTTFMLVLVG